MKMNLHNYQTKEMEKILKIMLQEIMNKLMNLINMIMMVLITRKYLKITKLEEERTKLWIKETENIELEIIGDKDQM
jgi:uncharacterized protein (UPF0297 family)